MADEYEIVRIGGHAIAHGDCLEVMEDIDDSSVDLILCDLPYANTSGKTGKRGQFTNCAWDTLIPLDKLWSQYLRVIKDHGAIVLTSAQPFTTILISSNMSGFCYQWIWNKRFAANFAQAKRMPLRIHEDVLVFSKSGKLPRFYPQKTRRDKPIKAGGNNQTNKAIPLQETAAAVEYAANKKVYEDKNPETIIEYTCRDGNQGKHPTQKPVDLMAYLIRTYSEPGDLVLDNTMGSGTTGVACVREGRRFRGIELERKYFDTAHERIVAETKEHTK